MKKHSPGFLKLVHSAKKRIKEISVKEVCKKLSGKESFHFVDVRESSEWIQGHAKNAVHISRGILERDIEHLIPDHNAEIVLYCGGGFRSALSADNIQKMGYKKVYSMAGGWRAWIQYGAPCGSRVLCP